MSSKMRQKPQKYRLYQKYVKEIKTQNLTTKHPKKTESILENPFYYYMNVTVQKRSNHKSIWEKDKDKK